MKQTDTPLVGALAGQRLREGEVLLACDGDVVPMELSERERTAIAAASSQSTGRSSTWVPSNGGLGAGRLSPCGSASSAFSSIAGHGSRSALRGLDLASASTSKARATRGGSSAVRRVETGLQIRTKKERGADRRNKLKLGEVAAAPTAASATLTSGESVDLLGLHDNKAGPRAPPGSPTGATEEREFQKQGGLDLFADFM